jgi:hypothetical protein
LANKYTARKLAQIKKSKEAEPIKKPSFFDKIKGKLKDAKVSIFKSILTITFTVSIGFTVVIGGSYITNKYFTSSDTARVEELADSIRRSGDSVRNSIAGLDSQLQSIQAGIIKSQETASRIDDEVQRANVILQQTSGTIKELTIGITGLIEHLSNGELNLTELKRSNGKLVEINGRLADLIKKTSGGK